MESLSKPDWLQLPNAREIEANPGLHVAGIACQIVHRYVVVEYEVCARKHDGQLYYKRFKSHGADLDFHKALAAARALGIPVANIKHHDRAWNAAALTLEHLQKLGGGP